MAAMAPTGYAATSSGSNMYLYNTSTSTNISTTTGAWGGSDPMFDRHGPPHRILQRQPLNARAVVDPKRLMGNPKHDSQYIDSALAVHDIDVKTIEIPYYRIYKGMKFCKVEPNTLLELPDGTFIDIEHEHKYTIHDAETQITREECTIRAFNRFLNASELLEAFIKDMAPAGIRQDQVLKVPIEAFINWIIFRAAEEDGDELPDEFYNHRCIYCKRFIPRRHVVMGMNFCNGKHLDGYINKVKLLEAQ